MGTSRSTSRLLLRTAATLAAIVAPVLAVDAVKSQAPAAPKAPPAPRPVPPSALKPGGTFPITINGVAVDQKGHPVAGASIFVLSLSTDPWSRVARTTTDRNGLYTFDKLKLPYSRLEGVPRAGTPYGGFQVFGKAPGFGVAWHPQQRAYAVADVDPDDIQGYPRLGEPVEADLEFRPADRLEGRVVDERGRGVERVKVVIHDGVTMDREGTEVGRTMNGDWPTFMPDGIGGAETDRDGRFRLEGLPAETCFWLWLTRPGPGGSLMALYAATTSHPEAVNRPGHLPGGFGNGRTTHHVEAGAITLTFPSTRKVIVKAVYDDTGKPVPGLHVNVLNSQLATGINAGGTTNAEGIAVLAAPPGEYRGLHADPPRGSSYVRTYKRPFVVADSPDEQPVEFRLRRGSELVLRAVEAGTDRGVPDVFFWISPAGQPRAWQYLRVSTFYGPTGSTDADGKLHAVLDLPQDAKYVIKPGGIHGKDLDAPQGWVAPARLGGLYQPVKAESDPIALPVGQTVNLTIELTK